MVKRKDIRIYINSHKEVDYGIWDNSLYTPLECGAALRDKVFKTRDNTGDNISEWNPLYAENTGIYWIWKNRPKNLKYVGVCQYRRRLAFPEDYDFDFKDYDAIVAKPLNCYQSVENQYRNCHCLEDFLRLEELVKSMHPDYAEDWDKYIKKSPFILYSQGFVFKANDYDAYCEWLFGILHSYKEQIGWSSMDDVRNHVEKNIEDKKHNPARGLDYQSQVFGFFAERLFTLYVFHNFEKVMFVTRKNFEGVA